MFNTRFIQGIIISAIGIFLAIWLGMSLVTDQSTTLLQIAGVAFLVLCIFLGRKIWLLMIFLGALNIPLIRGFSTLEVGQMAFIGFSILHFLIRKFYSKATFGELELWMLLIAACIIQSYVRNPAGLNIFGGSSVGARPYFYASLAFLTGWLLSVLVVPFHEIRWAMRLTVIGTLVGIPISNYRTSSGLAAQGVVEEYGEGARRPWLNTTAQVLTRVLVSKMSPFQAIQRPLYLVGFLACILIAASSGYRNAVGYVGLLLVFGILYHHGIAAMMASLLAAAFCIALLAGVNLVAPLPIPMQRALSPFPGTWDERVVESGINSTEWRVEMWKEALFTPHWIRNKTFGDGLGLTRQELERLAVLSEGGRDAYRGRSGMTVQQENMMITGGYHSGPVHTIRTVGYVGLTIMLLAMIRVAVHAHRQIMRCRYTEWFGIALFFCLPIIIIPIYFTVFFGEFHSGFAGIAMGVGIVRLLEKNLPLPA